MSPADPRIPARRVPEELLTQGDAAVARALFAPSCRHFGVGAGPAGTETLVAFVAAVRRVVPDLSAVVDEAAAGSNVVAHRLTLAGTFPGAARREWAAVEWFRLGPDQRFTEHWLLADWPEPLLRLVGAVEARPPPRPAADSPSAP